MTACLTSPYALIGETKPTQPAHQLPRYFEPAPPPAQQPAPVAKPKPIVAPVAVAAPEVATVAVSTPMGPGALVNG